MYVSLNYVTAIAKTIVKTADNMDMNVWKDWVYLALLQLGISDDEIEVAEIHPINSHLVPIPPNLRSILELSLFDSLGNQLDHKYRAGKQRIYKDQRLSNTVVGSTTSINDLIPVDVSNDAYNIILGTNGNLVATVLLRYFKYPTDEEGQPLIREEDTMACALFIKYMQALREDDNQSKILNYENSWKQAADRAKADKKMKSLTPEKAKVILNEWMRSIPNFNSRLF